MLDPDVPDRSKAEAERYAREILRREAADAEARAAARVEPARRTSRGTLLIGLLVVATVLTAWNVSRSSRSPAVVSVAEEAAAARFAIYLVASAVERYRVDSGAWPANLRTIGLDEEGVEYSRSPAGYTLRGAGGDSVFTYRSGDSLELFRRAYAALQPEERP